MSETGYRNVNSETRDKINKEKTYVWLTKDFKPGVQFLAVPVGTSPEYTHAQLFMVTEWSKENKAARVLQYQRGNDKETTVGWILPEKFCKYWDFVDYVKHDNLANYYQK